MPFLDEIQNDVAVEPIPAGEKAPRLSVPFDELDGLTGQKITKEEIDFSALAFSQEEADALKAKGKIGFFESWGRTKGLEKIPVAGTGVAAYEAIAFNTAIRRLQKDDYKGDNTLKARDYEVAQKAVRYAAEEQLRGRTIGGQIVEGVTELPAFMVEFALSSMAAAPGAAAAGRIAAKAGVKMAASKAVQGAMVTGAKWGTQAVVGGTAAGAPRIVEQTFEAENKLNLVPTEKGLELSRRAESAPVTSFLQAWGDVVVENFSERAGTIVFNPMLNKVASAPAIAAVTNKVAELYKKIHPTANLSNLFTKVGWDGFISEMGEEVLGDQIRAVLNVSDFGATGGNTLDRMIAAIPDGDELMVMAGVLAVPGAAEVSFKSGVAAMDNYRNIKKAAGLKVTPETDAKTLAGQILQQGYDPVEEATKEALEAPANVELSKEEIAGIEVPVRAGEAQFEESKPVPERVALEQITSTKEFKMADAEMRMDLLVRGRTADIDRQRVEIEDRMSRLETEIKNLNAIGRPDVVILEGKKKELHQLSKQLLSVHAQIADTIDATAEELAKEKVLLPGETLETLTAKARLVGGRMARREAETVFRSEKASAEERRTALVKYLKARLPGVENVKLREKYELRAAKDFTEKQLQKYFTEIENLRETVRAKQLREKAYSIVEKMRSVVDEQSRKKGVFANANIQAIADTIYQAVTLSQQEEGKAVTGLKELLDETQSKLAQLIEAGDGESDAAYLLRAKSEAIQNAGGLEQRDASSLEDSIRWLTKKVNEFKTGRDISLELRKAQDKVNREAIQMDIAPSIKEPKNFGQKIFKKMSEGTQKLFSYTSFHLAEFWREVGANKPDSAINRLIVDRLERLPLLRNAVEQKIVRPFRKAMKDVYGLSDTKNGDFVKFVADRMTLEDTNDSETRPYDSGTEIELNNGEKQRIRLSRSQVIYWYALAHTQVGVEDAQAVEILTGENHLAAIREDVQLAKAGGQEITDIDRAVKARASEIKGNAIPAATLQEIFSTLTERDKQFAIQARQSFSSTWGLINPIYRRAMSVDLDRTESYVPWIRKPSAQQVIQDTISAHTLVEGYVSPFPGSLKVRRKNASAPFAQISIFEVMDTYSTTMGHWVASYEITSRMQRYLKDEGIREAINKATDGEFDQGRGIWKDGAYVRQMENHLKGIISQGKTDRVMLPVAFEALRRNLSRKALSDIKQAPMQLMSFVAALQKIGHVDLMKGMASFVRDPQAAYKVLHKGLSFYKRSENVQVELNELQAQINKYGKAKTLGPLRIDKSTFDRYAYAALTVGDIGAVTIGGWAVFRAEYAKTKDTQKAYAAFDAFTIGLMQSASREQQTSATTGTGRVLFQFISAITQYARAYYRAWADLGKGNIKPQEFARILVLYHVYTPALRWAVLNMFTPPSDDDDEEEKKMKKLAMDMAVGPFSGLWIMGDIVNLASQVVTGEPGFETNPAVTSEINKTRKAIAQAIRKAMDEDSEIEDVIDAVFKAEKQTTGLTMGVPSWLNDSVHATYKVSSGDWIAADIPGILYGHSVEMLDFSKGGK